MEEANCGEKASKIEAANPWENNDSGGDQVTNENPRGNQAFLENPVRSYGVGSKDFDNEAKKTQVETEDFSMRTSIGWGNGIHRSWRR